jgi:uncharacterized membrane protein
MAKKKVNKRAKGSPSNKIDDSKIYAFIASFLPLVGFIVALILWKDDKRVMFYAKEGLVLFIGGIIAIVLNALPLIGEYLYKICGIVIVALWVMTWIYALMEGQKRTFIIGDLAEKLEL